MKGQDIGLLLKLVCLQWHEHLHLGLDLPSIKDDASVLSLEYGEPAIKLQSDCDNFRECT